MKSPSSKKGAIQNRDPVLQLAKRLGFTVEPGGKHYSVKHPKGGSLAVSYNGKSKRSRYLTDRAVRELYKIVKSHETTLNDQPC
jgi:hypothetical protein